MNNNNNNYPNDNIEINDFDANDNAHFNVVMNDINNVLVNNNAYNNPNIIVNYYTGLNNDAIGDNVNMYD